MTRKPKLVALDSLCESGNDKSMQGFYNDITVDTLARTLWREARGQGTDGMQAVANVILNRVAVADAKGKFWCGNNIIKVCQKPYQFSCWNRSDPNFRKLQAVNEDDLYFATDLRLARCAVVGTLDGLTLGATHYHADSVTPYWAKGKKPSVVIGRHIFYTLVG